MLTRKKEKTQHTRIKNLPDVTLTSRRGPESLINLFMNIILNSN